MWKLLSVVPKRLTYKTNCLKLVIPQKRYFLSQSFKLESVWEERLQSPILKKININDLFYELDNQFQHFAYASALDIDIFVNAVSDDSNFDEIEDVVHKLRLSPEAINILPSTQHALIRLYIKYNKTDDLMRILDDRLNYGIFCDDYCSLLMMDTFIKAGNFRDAAKVGIFSMLQEDINNPLIKYMALYSCHKYLVNPVPWKLDSDQVTKDDDDDGEEVKVRVRFIRNPYFDDHFDLVDPNHLIGKTLSYFGSQIIDDDVGRTYRLLGLLLHDKFSETKHYLQNLSSLKETVIVKDGLQMAKDILDNKLKLEGIDGEIKIEVDALKRQLSNTFSGSQINSESNLLGVVESRITDLINKNETSEINKQLQIYQEWEKNRGQLLMEQIAKINKEKKLAEIQRQKQLLQEKEDELFFFDNEDKLDLIIEEKDRKKEVEKEKERQRELNKLDRPPSRKGRIEKKPEGEPPLESFFDENIPMKLIKTKL